MEFLAALQFLTIFPIKRGFTVSQLGRSTVFFPLVGLVIGLILAGINYLLSWLLPSGLVNIILIAILAILSGALHLDGLADTLDGIAGHRTVEERLAIMRDSRVGGFGAIGVAMFLLAEYVALNSIPHYWMPYALILAPTLSRWAMVVSIFSYPYARSSGLGSGFKERVSWRHLLIATLIALVVAVALFLAAGPVIMVLVWVFITLIAFYLVRKLNGLTGDTYGAVNEMATLTTLIVISMLVYKHWLV